MIDFGYKQGKANIALKIDSDYIWDASVIEAEGKYWLFCSHWPFSRGFNWNWCCVSRIFLAVSETPEGPYRFVKDIFVPRDKHYFDGRNTHNTCIKYHKGKFYLYYMGTTYDFPVPEDSLSVPEQTVYDVWNSKRIGLAISDKIDGEYVRRDTPLLEPRPYPKWDSAITTNPSVIIKENGETLMLYKSAIYEKVGRTAPLKIGVAIAPTPEGPFVRYTENPILDFKDAEYSFEDPCLWYDEKRKKYCAIMKDCIGNVTGQYGDLFYAESDDCKDFALADNPTVISRDVEWTDGHKSKQSNLERPCVLFNKDGEPTHIFCASGDGKQPWAFEGPTYVVCIKLEKKN